MPDADTTGRARARNRIEPNRAIRVKADALQQSLALQRAAIATRDTNRRDFDQYDGLIGKRRLSLLDLIAQLAINPFRVVVHSNLH
ncbi:hypothetical protein LGN19_35375 [Burkholderia sp. AU30198]|uniref:hypothetical protein n=1 Tax=Burkholderia sp. AU30198 TaxID=2879627 RepID=UPI001CF1BE28|nr:hypothetical protein [Burkholderia sp. AU30198]MCA8299074.1 hypothetical protein [Burkholderia sp. AU30198]